MGETGSDDGDIVLEEVSQIYRCKDCLRCFISFSKFAEHFPVYHPDKVQITAGNQQSAKESNSSHSPKRASQPGNIEDKDKYLAEKSTNDDTVVPKRKKIILKRSRLQTDHDSTSDSSETPSMGSSSSDDKGESEVPGKDAAISESSDYSVEEAINNEPQSNKTTNDEHEAIEGNIRKKQKTLIGSKENSRSHDEPNNHHQSTSPKALNESCSIVIVQNETTENDKPHEPSEVITLSDSDDESGTPASPKTIKLSSSIVKIEAVAENESDPRENDAAPRDQQPNDAQVTEGANDNEKSLEDKDTLPSSAPEKKLLCEFCTKPFTRERTLQSHMRSIHRSEFEAREEMQKKKDSRLVDNCSDKDSSSEPIKPNKRKRNMKVTGTGVKTSDKNVVNVSLGFTCKWCPRRFRLLEELKNHAYNEHIKYKAVV